MRVILIHHGEAQPKEQDAGELLSRTGRQSVARLALFLGGSGLKISQFLHSGKAAARQTADMLAATLESESVDLLTEDPMPQLSDGPGEKAFVGTLPQLVNILNALFQDSPPSLDLPSATAIGLKKGEDGRYTVFLLVGAHLLGAID